LNRGELYRVYKASKSDPKKSRVFCIVSRQVLIDSKFSTVICAPVYSNCAGISTQVKVGVEEGLKHASCIACDELVSLSKNVLTNYIGKLTAEKINELNKALCIATGVL
jgi:mRNA interferase MazF